MKINLMAVDSTNIGEGYYIQSVEAPDGVIPDSAIVNAFDHMDEIIIDKGRKVILADGMCRMLGAISWCPPHIVIELTEKSGREGVYCMSAGKLIPYLSRAKKVKAVYEKRLACGPVKGTDMNRYYADKERLTKCIEAIDAIIKKYSEGEVTA